MSCRRRTSRLVPHLKAADANEVLARTALWVIIQNRLRGKKKKKNETEGEPGQGLRGNCILGDFG